MMIQRPRKLSGNLFLGGRALALMLGLVLELPGAFSGEAGFLQSRVFAQSVFQGPSSGDAPVSISADNGIEWDRTKKVYIAKGNAQAAQGDFFIAAENLTAYYDEVRAGNPDIHTIIAEGNVFIESGTDMMTGDKVTYKVKQEHAVVTGKLIILQTAQGQLSAKKQVIYDGLNLFAEATGDPQVAQGENIVTADRLKAFFTTGPGVQSGGQSGSGQIKKVEGRGDVFVTNGASSCRAESVDYSVATEVAVLKTNVRCTQCGNQLVGDLATMDLRAGQATVTTTNAAGSNKRVYLFFDPASKQQGC